MPNTQKLRKPNIGNRPALGIPGTQKGRPARGKKQFTDKQIAHTLGKVESGEKIAGLCWEGRVYEQNYGTFKPSLSPWSGALNELLKLCAGGERANL